MCFVCFYYVCVVCVFCGAFVVCVCMVFECEVHVCLYLNVCSEAVV